jgi:hypothetical protein
MVLRPDLADEDENHARKRLLMLKRQFIFDALPSGIRWTEARLSPAELRAASIIDSSDDWWEFGPPYTIGDAAWRTPHLSQSEDEETQYHVAKIMKLADELDPRRLAGKLILIAPAENAPLTVLEGNHRAIALCLKQREDLVTDRVLVGLSPQIEGCRWYRGT